MYNCSRVLHFVYFSPTSCARVNSSIGFERIRSLFGAHCALLAHALDVGKRPLHSITQRLVGGRPQDCTFSTMCSCRERCESHHRDFRSDVPALVDLQTILRLKSQCRPLLYCTKCLLLILNLRV